MSKNSYYFNVTHFCKESEALGPYKRAILYLQGCQKNCFNCVAPDWQKFDVENFQSADSLFDELDFKTIEGVTISGGEPFLQSRTLSYFVEKIRKESNLGIIIFTGYSYKELIMFKNNYINRVLNSIDLLVDGEYIDSLNEGIGFRGSKNQSFIFLTERYLGFENYFLTKKRDLDIKLEDNIVVGIPPLGLKICNYLAEK